MARAIARLVNKLLHGFRSTSAHGAPIDFAPHDFAKGEFAGRRRLTDR